MAVEQQEIAQALQLSKATVSRSLRNDPLISAATRARVREAAMRMGYVANAPDAPVPSRLSRRRGAKQESGLLHLGVICRGELPQSLSGIVALRQLHGMSAAARTGRATLHVEYLPPDEFDALSDAERWPAILRDRFVSGVVFLSHSNAETVNRLAEAFPVMQCFWPSADMHIDSVTDNSLRSVSQIFRHLTGLGHRRIGIADFGYFSPSERLRLAGYLASLNEYAMPYDRADSQFIDEPRDDIAARAAKVADHVLRRAREQGARAWICTDDVLGYALMRALNERGMRVPQDISICGFDNFDPPPGAPKLTTIDSPFEEIGGAAIQQLLKRVIDPTAAPSHCLVASKLIVGESTGPLAGV